MAKVKTKANKDSELVKFKNQLVRALADYDNLRKRTEREKQEVVKFSNRELLISLLPVLDNLESTQTHLKDPGLQMSIDSFKNVLAQERVGEIEARKGTKFDENLHEVLEVVEKGKAGEIAEVVLTGWKFDEGPVIRPTKVKVGKKKE